MSTKIPYVNAPGYLIKILDKARDAKTPDRFTTDFLETKLGFKGGNYRQFVPFAKKMGFLNSDGSPSELYKKFRNSATSKVAIAEGIRIAYKELFERNEYAYNLKKDELQGLVVEITGLDNKNRVVQLICQTFEMLKKNADFETFVPSQAEEEADAENPSTSDQNNTNLKDFGLNLAYTINLVLPKTDDPAVFNAIFRALKDNLLRK